MTCKIIDQPMRNLFLTLGARAGINCAILLARSGCAAALRTTCSTRTAACRAPCSASSYVRQIAQFIPARALIAACLISVAAAPASANAVADWYDDFQTARAQGRPSTHVNIDNDTLLLNQRDGFYTSGGRIAREYWLHDATQSTGFGWRIGQELYTASDIKLPPESISPLDRPYAGWLFGGLYKETYRADGYHDKVGVDIGCLGPCAGGEWTQRNLHRLLHQPLPQAWSQQVRNELGIVLYADVAPIRWAPHAAIDIAPSYHGRFGNIFTDAGVAVKIRAGRLNMRPDQSTLHGFMRLDASVVGYNATLQGGYFSRNDPHTVKPKRWVGEAELGVLWSRKPWGFSASVVRRSSEVDGLSNAFGAQSYARFVFSYSP